MTDDVIDSFDTDAKRKAIFGIDDPDASTTTTAASDMMKAMREKAREDFTARRPAGMSVGGETRVGMGKIECNSPEELAEVLKGLEELAKKTGASMKVLGIDGHGGGGGMVPPKEMIRELMADKDCPAEVRVALSELLGKMGAKDFAGGEVEAKEQLISFLEYRSRMHSVARVGDFIVRNEYGDDRYKLPGEGQVAMVVKVFPDLENMVGDDDNYNATMAVALGKGVVRFYNVDLGYFKMAGGA